MRVIQDKLPDNIVEIYRATPNIKKIAKQLGVAQHRVRYALTSAGIDPVRRNKHVGLTLCCDCKFATAAKCSYIKADNKYAEAILIKAGCEYIEKNVTFKDTGDASFIVTACPKYKTGSLVLQ
jgi:hypothetical protein